MKKLLIIGLISVFSLGTINAASIQAGGNYTSVIVDCSSLGLVRAMSPIVRNGTGEEVYPASAADTMNMKTVLEGGVVTYEKSVDKAVKNKLAGGNPLILKAISIEGILKSDPVISRLDSIRLALANSEGRFLNKRKVILVY
jgi:hypothetical protein